MPAACSKLGNAAGMTALLPKLVWVAEVGRRTTTVVLWVLFAFAISSPALAATVRITGLQDVVFAALDPALDATNSQSICVYSDTATNGYSVTAYGSGAGSAFLLSGGAVGGTLGYELQWNQLPGKTTGTQLSPGAALSGQVSSATQQRCSNGPSSSASLLFILRSSKLQSATSAIACTGTMTIGIAPQ